MTPREIINECARKGASDCDSASVHGQYTYMQILLDAFAPLLAALERAEWERDEAREDSKLFEESLSEHVTMLGAEEEKVRATETKLQEIQKEITCVLFHAHDVKHCDDLGDPPCPLCAVVEMLESVLGIRKPIPCPHETERDSALARAEAQERELAALRELAEAGAHYYLGEHGFTWYDDSEAMLVLDEKDFSESAHLALIAYRAKTRFEDEWIGHSDYDVYRASLDALRAAQAREQGTGGEHERAG